MFVNECATHNQNRNVYDKVYVFFIVSFHLQMHAVHLPCPHLHMVLCLVPVGGTLVPSAPIIAHRTIGSLGVTLQEPVHRQGTQQSGPDQNLIALVSKFKAPLSSIHFTKA